MAEQQPKKNPIMRRLLAGLIAVAPIVVTWVILSFLFQQLSYFGRPLIRGLSSAIRPTSPPLADFISNQALQSVLAVVVVLIGIYLLGWLAERIAGRRLIGLVDALAQRIPIVQTIYRATKRFLDMTSPTNDDQKVQRVVLIDFPSPEMKTVGLLTHSMRDSKTGEELAVVYVPTTPNPTSGYLEILPIKSLTFTDWTFDQAMAFIVTAGSNAPDTVNYRDKANPYRAPEQP
jgi:uncharacterized membrane protein